MSVNVDRGLRLHRQLRAMVPSVFALILGVCAPTAFAEAVLPPGNSDANLLPGLSPEVSKLVRDAATALKGGNLNLALIELKNAVRLAPQSGSVRAQLGLALLQNEPGGCS